MTQEFSPISPPPELVSEWRLAPEFTDGLKKLTMVTITADRLQYIATQAARWGSDQELESCCEWLETGPYGFSIEATAPSMTKQLRIARRLKPPSLKEQALFAIDTAVADGRLSSDVSNVVRRALESLPD